MGVVWKARDERLNRLVALKLLPEVVAGDPEAVKDLLRETNRCLELTHPHIVRVYDLVQDGPLAAISMEYVDGESLAKRKAAAPGGCLTLEELRPLTEQLCTALDYAHRVAKVVHRDLKPANLLLTRNGQLKVTDFGIARSLSDTHTRLTGRVSNTSGTLLYMSPQQLRGEDPSASDDIYAFGATLYELLAGKPPFHTGDVAWQIREAEPKPVNSRLATLGRDPVPAEWEETIQACLAKNPEDRPQSAAEVARRLDLTTDSAPVRAEPSAGGDAKDGKKAKAVSRGAEREHARQNIDDAATRRAGLSLGDPEPVKGQETIPPQGAKRKSWPLLVAGLAALTLGVLAYAFWPRSILRPDASGLTDGSVLAGSHEHQRVDLPIVTQLREFTVTVDPPDVGARLWLGPLSDVEIKDGKASLKDVPDGEQELTVQAPGYQPFTTRVTVKEGRGSFEARLVPVRGEVSVTARPGTQVTAVDERGRETRVGSVPAGGVLDVANLLTVGRYTLKLEHTDCAAVTVPGVELVIGRTIKVAPEQTPLPAELRVFSVPTGAEVRVNGTVTGSTPATIKNQPSEQALRIEVFQHGYRRVDQSVTLKPKEARTLNVGTLVAEAGGIALRMTDSQFSIANVGLRIDGKPIEVARVGADEPFVIDGLEVGSRTVEIVHPDYEPWRQVVSVRDQETTAVNVELKPKPGTVDFGSVPQGARVFINGGDLHEAVFSDNATKVENLTPFRGALPPGSYTLRFELKGYKSATRTATVAANRTAEVSAALEKLRGAEEGQAWTVPDLNLEMAYIRPGTFTMGSGERRQRREAVDTGHAHQGLLAGEDRGDAGPVRGADGKQSIELQECRSRRAGGAGIVERCDAVLPQADRARASSWTSAGRLRVYAADGGAVGVCVSGGDDGRLRRESGRDGVV